MSEITKPIALDESLHTTEQTPRNLADVLSDELQNLATAISGGSDKVPKTDIATVEPTNTASRAYSVGELVYVNGTLYEVKTAIAIGATFTVGTNIQSTTVSGTVKDALDNLPVKIYKVTGTTGTLNEAVNISAPTGADTEKLVVIGFNVRASNGYWYSNVGQVEVLVVTSSTIRVKATDGGYASQPIVVLVAEYT